MFRILGLFLQHIIDLVGAALTFLLSIFPDSPFTIIQNSQFADLIAKINFFIPVYEFISILQAWLVAIAVYYLYTVYARWVKAIQ
jgi:hypothetical protein